MRTTDYEVVIGQSSDGRIELPFTYDMLNPGVSYLGSLDIDESKLNDVELSLRRTLFALDDKIVNKFLEEWFYEEEEKEWLSNASKEEKLCWVIQLIEYDLREEVDGDSWSEHCQPFESAA